VITLIVGFVGFLLGIVAGWMLAMRKVENRETMNDFDGNL